MITGIETREPTYGLPALWIESDQREAARKAKYTLVDPETVLFTHLCEQVRQRSADLLTRAEVERMLTRLREGQPGLVEELVPTQLSLSEVQKVFQNLLREKVPVRHLQAIIEGLIDGARVSKDPSLLTEVVRQRLSLAICNAFSNDQKTLQVLTLDPAVEESLMRALTPPRADGSEGGAPDPRVLETTLMRVAAAAERMLKVNLIPLLICAPALRRHLRSLCERAAPHLHVISLSEIANGFDLKVFAAISASSVNAGVSSGMSSSATSPASPTVLPRNIQPSATATS
jgi:flagellar biosynthesis protein FlhA